MEDNINDFWKFSRWLKGQNKEQTAKIKQTMSFIANDIINYNECKKCEKWYDLYSRYARGHMVYDTYGNELYFKLGEDIKWKK